MTGLLTPKNGKIFINADEVTKLPVYLRTKRYGIGYVPQHGGAFADLSLHDNLRAIVRLS